MEVETKLDEDFLFYMNFINTFFKRLSDPDVFRMCRNWIFKLCTEPCQGINMKRCRNMYLANLLICMQNAKMEEPFLQAPFHVDISNAMEVFGQIPDTVEKPDWLNDTDYQIENRRGDERKGRTYFATRTLPHGQGAFAYIGVSLTGDDWIGPAVGAGDTSIERGAALERQFEQHYREQIPQYELEKILAKRKDPKEREKVLTFYDVLLQNVADELDGKGPATNETVEGLLEQLVEDLKAKDQFAAYEGLEDHEKRLELLLALYDRIKTRRDKVAKREEILDDIEHKIVPKSFFDVSATEPDDQYELPAAMWQQAIDKMPTKKQVERLKIAYVTPVVEKFIVLLAGFKEDIAERMHRRHERIATQMKKELRKEGLKKKKEADKMETICRETEEIFNAVKEHYKKKTDAEEANRNQFEVALSDHSRLYEEMKSTVLDTQKLVEDEAAKGKFLASQINAVSEQGAIIGKVNDDMMKKTEEANMKILRNIKRINMAIKQFENRITEFNNMAENTKKGLMSFGDLDE